MSFHMVNGEPSGVNSFCMLQGDALAVLQTMPDACIHCCVTSPPYWGLRDYGVAGQIGLEPTLDEFISKLVAVFREVRRVLKPDGTLWVNMGDSYAMSTHGRGGKAPSWDRNKGNHLNDRTLWPIPSGLKAKDLCGQPWRLALALQADGWWLRSDIIWHKLNPMPESCTDRPTKAHEYIFLLAASERYYYDADAIAEPAITEPGTNSGGSLTRYGPTEKLIAANAHRGQRVWLSDGKRNKRTVWSVASMPVADAHFATYPLELPETCILAGCPPDGMVLDPFAGSGTTGLAAIKHGRQFTGIELNASYIEIAHKRADRHMPLLAMR